MCLNIYINNIQEIRVVYPKSKIKKIYIYIESQDFAINPQFR